MPSLSRMVLGNAHTDLWACACIGDRGAGGGVRRVAGAIGGCRRGRRTKRRTSQLGGGGPKRGSEHRVGSLAPGVMVWGGQGPAQSCAARCAMAAVPGSLLAVCVGTWTRKTEDHQARWRRTWWRLWACGELGGTRGRGVGGSGGLQDARGRGGGGRAERGRFQLRGASGRRICGDHSLRSIQAPRRSAFAWLAGWGHRGFGGVVRGDPWSPQEANLLSLRCQPPGASCGAICGDHAPVPHRHIPT